jgi:hypothetical protein
VRGLCLGDGLIDTQLAHTWHRGDWAAHCAATAHEQGQDEVMRGQMRLGNHGAQRRCPSQSPKTPRQIESGHF